MCSKDNLFIDEEMELTMDLIAPKNVISEYTRLYTSDRFPDGRPHVPDDLLKRLETATTEQAWGGAAETWL